MSNAVLPQILCRPLIAGRYPMTRSLLVKLAAGLFWLALAFTLVMALLPQPPVALEANDKVSHMLAFAFISGLAAAAFPHRRLWELFIAMVLLGGLIEILQLIPALHRDAEVMDWVADCVAIFVTFLIWWAGRSLFGSQRRQPCKPVDD